MNATDLLARYWAREHAKLVRDGKELGAVLAVSGVEADAIGSATGFGNDFMDDLGWLAGYLTFPCDAVYISAAFDVEVDLVLGWSHLIATRETATRALGIDPMACRFVAHEVEPVYGDTFFEPLLTAAHVFDGVNLHEQDRVDRKVARDMVVRNNGTNYQVELHPPGHVLDLARLMERG